MGVYMCLGLCVLTRLCMCLYAEGRPWQAGGRAAGLRACAGIGVQWVGGMQLVSPEGA